MLQLHLAFPIARPRPAKGANRGKEHLEMQLLRRADDVEDARRAEARSTCRLLRVHEARGPPLETFESLPQRLAAKAYSMASRSFRHPVDPIGDRGQIGCCVQVCSV